MTAKAVYDLSLSDVLAVFSGQLSPILNLNIQYLFVTVEYTNVSSMTHAPIIVFEVAVKHSIALTN